MSLTKQRISSPLEAGRSLLDAHNLPPHLTGALEYASKRLAKKALHITLVVVRHDYQIPNASPTTTPSFSAIPVSPPATPESGRFGLRQLVRRGTNTTIASNSSTSFSTTVVNDTAPSSTTVSPTFPPPPTEPLRRWMVLPPTPGSPFPRTPLTPRTPRTPHTPCSAGSTTTSTTTTASCGPFGLRLLPASTLPAKAEKILQATLAKAARRFPAAAGDVLPLLQSTGQDAVPPEVVRRSILQNEVLFASEGLTLLGLDRLYSFKAALAAYARSLAVGSPPPTPLASPGLSNHPVALLPATPSTPGCCVRLEDAVDALRRLVLLSYGGRGIERGDLFRIAADGLGTISIREWREVEKMYRRAYGGPERRGPFADACVHPLALAEREEEEDEEKNTQRQEEAEAIEQPPPPPQQQQHKSPQRIIRVLPSPPPLVKLATPPPPKTQTTPVLKLNTNLPTRPKARAPPLPQPQECADSPTIRLDTGLCFPIPMGSTKTGNKGGSGGGAEKPDVAVIRIDVCERRSSASSSSASASASSCSDATARQPYTHTHNPVPPDGPVRASMLRRLGYGGAAAAGLTIDELLLLSPVERRGSETAEGLGPMTPNGYEDISPITRGEWGFLFQGAGLRDGGRRAAVETC
ncbi:hypothetical protein F4780DRAFT_34161 [Xylariomycetidae sp. FL0641]|nr:hypothetical protein F4780DRAFT_34161 [Xylariomycetidae sp. FL0641]